MSSSLRHVFFNSTCLALRFQMWSWMLFIDFRNSNKMAAVCTVQTSSIRIFNFLYFPNVTLKTWWAYTFSASQIDCRPTPLESQMRAAKHQTDMNFADFSVNNTQPTFIKLYMHTSFSIVMLFQKLYVMKF